MRDSLDLIKVGGAILTDKTKLRTSNASEISRFINLVACNETLRKPVIFLAGGGSFGNASAHPLFDRNILCVRNLMAEWQNILSTAFYKAGVDVKVITARNLWRDKEGGIFNYGLIAENIEKKNQVIVLGDLIKRDGREKLLSSDLLPLFLSSNIPINKAIMITNRLGLLNGTQLIRHIEPNSSLPIGCIEPSSVPDATGGMGLKVYVMRKLAKRGITGHICGSEVLNNPMGLLKYGPPSGTTFKACHRIHAI